MTELDKHRLPILQFKKAKQRNKGKRRRQKRMSDKTEDLISAVKEEGLSTLLKSDLMRSVAEECADLFANEATSAVIGAIVGAIAPRANGIMLSYKQNRFERNVKSMIRQLSTRLATLEANYLALSEDMQKQITGIYVEMMLDNVIDERQEEKIRWNVNGFVNLMSEEANENIMQMFFDTLAELTSLDVDVLKIYSHNDDVGYGDVQDKYAIGPDRLKLVKEKLTRLGLLSRKNDIQRDNNIDEITEYLQKVEKDSKKTKPQGVKFPSAVKKISTIETYRITSLGSGFLKSIADGI